MSHPHVTATVVAWPRPPFVLMYHSIDQRAHDPYRVTVSPRRFVQQLSWLHRLGWRGVSLARLWQAQERGEARGMVGLTFDDGYADFHWYALPELMRRGFTATVFMVAGRIGAANDWDDGFAPPLLNQRQLADIAAAGMEIGSHGLRHPRLPEISPDELRAELHHSRDILQQIAGVEVTGFCYPYGDRDERVTQAVREAGYDYACATWASGAPDRHALPRTYVGQDDGVGRLLAKRLRHLRTWGRA